MTLTKGQSYNRKNQLLECVRSNKPTAEKLITIRRCLEQRCDVNATDHYGNTPLHLAVFRDRIIIMKLLLKRGANVNAKFKSGYTPLHEAASSGRTLVVKLLLNHSADVNVKTKNGDTPLHEAVCSGVISIVELLLNSGADVNAQTTEKLTPLHRAANYRNAFLIELLLKRGSMVNAQTIHGHTPLHAAALVGEASIVELLLKHGADVNAQVTHGITPLHEAARSGATSVVKMLLNNGANVTATSNSGDTPLHEAARSGATSVVKMLLNNGANVTATSNSGDTPLHEAVRSEAISTVELLLKHDADVNAQIANGETPLHEAASSGVMSVVELLLNNGANVNVATNHGFTPLHEAANFGMSVMRKLLLNSAHNMNTQGRDNFLPQLQVAVLEKIPVVELLLNKNAKVNAKTKTGHTPLHFVARTGMMSIVELLLTLGADVNAKTTDGYTPLHESVRSKKTPIVKLLLNKGAEVNGKSKDGYTPLHGAASSGQTSMVELLLNNGADVNATSTDGNTPLQLAARLKEITVVKLLLNRGANIHNRDRDGYTPLHEAVGVRTKSASKLKTSPDMNTNSMNGDTAQHEAARSRALSTVELLLNKGAEVNAKTTGGYTPLHEAALFEETSIVQLLIDRGANVNALTEKNNITPLHLAVNSGEISKVETLLNKGANVNSQKIDGDTPLHVALRNEDVTIATLLIRHGADVMLKNKTQDSPILYASLFSFKDNTKIVSVLKNAENKIALLNNNYESQSSSNDFFNSNQDILLNKGLQINKTKYLKTTDTSGLLGQLYETKMVSLVYIRVLNHEQVEHMLLGANINGIGAMDDICLRYRVRDQQRPVMLFVQIKHKEDERRKLTEKVLWNDSGDFSLRKYFKSYLMIRERFRVGHEDPMFEGKFSDVDCYFVLYTSAKENITKKNTAIQISDTVHHLLNTGKNTKPFRYSYNEADLRHLAKVTDETQIEHVDVRVDEFFSRLWFYSSQAKENEVECKVKDEINKFYNNDKTKHEIKFEIHSNAIFLKAHDEIQKWWKQEGTAPYLCRSNDFFKLAKLACLYDVFLTVINAVNYLNLGVELGFHQHFKQCNISIGTSRAFNAILSRLFKIFDSENKLITVDTEFKNDIVKLLLTDERENSLPNSDQSKAFGIICESDHSDVISKDHQLNEYVRRAGTSGVGGTLFRIKMLSLVLLRVLNHDQIEQDALLGTKIRGISVMSDICLRYKVKGQQRPVMLFVQLIYREHPEKGCLTDEVMWSDSGKFSLKKYFASYLSIKNRFRVGNDDPMFEGDFSSVDCYFFLYTSASESFSEKKTKRQVSEVVQNLINTGQNSKVHEYDHDEADIDCLTKMTALDQIEKLGAVFIKLITSKKYKPDNIWTNKLIAKYHVAMGREVLQQCEIQSANQEYRLWEFRSEFFNSDNEYLVTLKKIFDKIWPLENDRTCECQQSIKSDDNRENLQSKQMKLPLAFGNLDMTFRGKEDKIRKRMKILANTLIDLLKLNKDTKFVEISDNNVGPGKPIEHGFMDINGGIGSAVGNLLVSDTVGNIFKFNLDNKVLPHNAALFLKELKDDRYKPINEELSLYRIKINIDGFPKDSFVGDECDKKQARDFLNTFWFYSDQAKEDEVERILKEEMNKKYSENQTRFNYNENKVLSDTISLHSLDEMQKWWMQTSESPYLSRASELFERAELADIYNRLQTVINFMYISNIDRIDIKVKQLNLYARHKIIVKVFKNICSQLFKLFDPQFSETFDFGLHHSGSRFFNRSKLSLSIHPEMEWVALVMLAGPAYDDSRIIAKAGPRRGCSRAKDEFMILEQTFDSHYCTTRDCLKNSFVEIHSMPSIKKLEEDPVLIYDSNYCFP